MKITAVTTELMRKSDAWTIANRVPSRELMRRAGEGIFRVADWKAPVGIVCGKGNNAGDGFVVAALLKEAGIDCDIILLSDKFSEDGRYYFDAAVRMGISVTQPDLGSAGVPNAAGDDIDWHALFSKYNTILDCIYGTGFHGSVPEQTAAVIQAINSGNAYVVSADINSGMNGDTGVAGVCVRSDLTVAVGNCKIGMFTPESREYIGQLTCVDIGIIIQGEGVEVEADNW